MERFFSAAGRFLREEEGVTAIEYALIAALIAVAIVATVTAIGTSLCNTFNKVLTGLGSAPVGCPGPPA